MSLNMCNIYSMVHLVLLLLLLLLGSSSTGRQEVVAEYFAKCWLCSKGFPSSSVLRDHLQTVHNESAAATAAAMAVLQPMPTSTSSSSSTSSLTPMKHTCLQCNATFAERDELERHELTHSPTAQVVRTPISCTSSRLAKLATIIIPFTPIVSLVIFYFSSSNLFNCSRALLSSS